jgi:formylglycine-generating enzyme required for sulfatase activity
MGEDGRPKLTDFGVARLLSETQRLNGTDLVQMKVRRDRAWNSVAQNLRVAKREQFGPNYRSGFVGFRCAASP